MHHVDSVSFDALRMRHPRQAIRDYIEQLIPTVDPTMDRRAARRFVTTFPAVAVALNENFEPEGNPFVALVHNISTHGLAMVHIRPVAAKYVGVELRLPRGQNVQVIIEITRCELIGLDYEIAGRFVHAPDE
ncbi:MAG: hypothetical protein WD847_14270 [Pirellulales bacterium]